MSKNTKEKLQRLLSDEYFEYDLKHPGLIRLDDTFDHKTLRKIANALVGEVKRQENKNGVK